LNKSFNTFHALLKALQKWVWSMWKPRKSGSEIGAIWYQNIRSALFGFVTKHACDRWMDGRTDRRTESRPPRPR